VLKFVYKLLSIVYYIQEHTIMINCHKYDSFISYQIQKFANMKAFITLIKLLK